MEAKPSPCLKASFRMLNSPKHCHRSAFRTLRHPQLQSCGCWSVRKAERWQCFGEFNIRKEAFKHGLSFASTGAYHWNKRTSSSIRFRRRRSFSASPEPPQATTFLMKRGYTTKDCHEHVGLSKTHSEFLLQNSDFCADP